MVSLAEKVIGIGEIIPGVSLNLRLVTLDDCTPIYVSWLNDSSINKYLETRWFPQTESSVRQFVSNMLGDPQNYLFAIIQKKTNRHIGNIKIGPIHPHHHYADISYFIGVKELWGKGLATEAIQLASAFAFQKLGIHRLQAGLYEGNIASAKSLEKAGYEFEAKFKKQLKAHGGWEDHLWYAKLNSIKEL